MPPSLSRLDEHSIFILTVWFVIVLFWHSTWVLLDELFEHLHKRYRIEKWKASLFLMLCIMVLILYLPQILNEL